LSVFEKVAKVVKNRPWMVVALCLLITVGLGLGILSLKGHVTYQSLLPQEFPSVKALASLRKNFGGISYEYVLVHAPDVTDDRVVEAMLKLEDRMGSDPRFNAGQIQTHVNAQGAKVPVIQDYLTPFAAVMQNQMAQRGYSMPISSISSTMVKGFTGMGYQQLVNSQYLANPQASAQVVGRFITPDHKTALIMVKDGAGLTDKQQVKLGGDLESFFKDKLGTVPGVTISIAGDATLARDFNTHIKNKTILLFVIAIILVLLTLFMAFRRLSDTFMPIAVMLLALVWTFGFAGWVGIQYSVAVIAVMPLLLGHALTFVVPFIARYYEEAERFAKLVDSAGKALVAVGVALFLAAITNLVGFLVFGFSVLPALRDFGVTCAVGNLFVFILSVTLLPSVIVLRDRAYEKTAGVKAKEAKQYFDGLSLRKSHGVFTRATTRVLGSFSNLSLSHTVPLVIVFAVLIAAGFTQIHGLTTDSDLRKLVPGSLPGMSANFQVEKYFGGNQQDVVEVQGDVLAPQSLKAMADLEKAIVSPEETGGRQDLYKSTGIIGLSDALTAGNNGKLPTSKEEALAALKTAEDNGGYVTGGLLSADHKAGLITLNASGAQSTAVVDKKIEILKKNSDKYLRPVGLSYTLGGITPLTKDMTKNIIPTETWSSMLALGLCAIVLILIFRSFSYGLITLTVALAGVAAEIGFLRIVGWPLDIMTSLVSALVIGIGVNFGILFTHRFIQERKREGATSDDALATTMNNLGRANVIAALTTVAAFVIVMFSGIVPLRRFGGVTAVAITVCLVTSLTLMPALLMIHSRRLEARALPKAEPEPEPA
jgi:predicted RND superfamily exporter protein